MIPGHRVLFVACVVATGACKPSPGSPHKQLAAATMTTCQLNVAGKVTCWGNAGSGTLGNGETEHFPGARLPGAVVDLDDAVQISVGLSNVCAVRRDHTVACWGIDTGNRPKPIAGLTNMTQVAAGRGHVCALHDNGQVSCWGENGNCQAGQPFRSIIDKVRAPQLVEGVKDAVEIAAAETSTCARLKDGRVVCWGTMEPPPIEDCEPGPGMIACAKLPADGVLDRAAIGKHVPRVIEGMTDITSIAAGDNFVCGVSRSGELLCAGMNRLGELGTGDTKAVTGAILNKTLKDVKRVSAADWTACALVGSGEVWCWGWGVGGVLVGADAGSHGPVLIPGLGKAVDVAVGNSHACAALENSSIVCWGSGESGQTGHGHLKEAHGPRRVRL